MSQHKIIYVVCPSNTVTGGSELLHQLVQELRQNMIESYIVYWPFTQSENREKAFLKYDAPVGSIMDKASNLVIVPEILTRCLRQIHRASTAVWWLSVDNYFLFPQNHEKKSPFVYAGNRLFDPLRRLRTLWRIRQPLRAMRHVAHYAQSHYALDFLNKNGLKGELLTDYLSSEHFAASTSAITRKNQIVFNPKKGIEVTKHLIASHPELKFVPLQGMSPAQVALTLRESKLYIDFGHHPGKDRPPREAVIAGCCVITGLSGAAAVPQDTPIPKDYRLDPRLPEFSSSFASTVARIFEDFDQASSDFEIWREKIRGEEQEFKRQVRDIFC